MSTDVYAEVMEKMAAYYRVIGNADPGLSAVQVVAAANVLRDLEEDPYNCVDYKSIGIAINEAKWR